MGLLMRKTSEEHENKENTEKHEQKENEESISVTDALFSRHRSGEIGEKELFHELNKETLYYSDPYGDHKSGHKRLFLLQDKDKVLYNPVFTSAERLKQYYKEKGRVGIMILKGSFLSVLEKTKASNKKSIMRSNGIILDPGHVTLMIKPDKLEAVINKTKD